MSKQIISEIVGKETLSKDICKLTLKSVEISESAKPGQFIEVKCSNGIDVLLRRPISISNVNKHKGEVDIVFQIKGKGTKALAEKKQEEVLDIIGPLGRGFTVSDSFKRIAIVGGGIGVFPLLFLAGSFKNTETITYLGFRNIDQIIMLDNFKQVSDDVKVATDDGSFGHHALVTQVLERDLVTEKFDMIYACGPKPMLKSVIELASKNKLACEISIEERMGCGVGACLGCACMIKEGEDIRYGHVCKDGPVFNAKDILLD